jgi:hypothetical protein
MYLDRNEHDHRNGRWSAYLNTSTRATVASVENEQLLASVPDAAPCSQCHGRGALQPAAQNLRKKLVALASRSLSLSLPLPASWSQSSTPSNEIDGHGSQSHLINKAVAHPNPSDLSDKR